MMSYRFFLVNKREAVLSFQEHDCLDDAEAGALGGRMARAGADVEVWDLGRLVSRSAPCLDVDRAAGAPAQTYARGDLV
jgi:hypothetical protein